MICLVYCSAGPGKLRMLKHEHIHVPTLPNSLICVSAYEYICIQAYESYIPCRMRNVKAINDSAEEAWIFDALTSAVLSCSAHPTLCRLLPAERKYMAYIMEQDKIYHEEVTVRPTINGLVTDDTHAG